jgi:coniferyl-aldehyde dehydrogenase
MPSALQDIFKRQKMAFRAQPYPSHQTRESLLDKCIHLLSTHHHAISEAERKDFGCRPSIVSSMNDVLPSLMTLKHAKKHVAKWMRPEKKTVPIIMRLTGAKATLHHQPKGVVGIVCPWNMPMTVMFGPLADALAAGNRVMIKVSEFSPATSALIHKLFLDTFPEDEIAVIQGGEDVAKDFCALPFDHLVFTGSTNIGRHVMRAAAEHLTPVTLELGGKCPAVISGSTDLKKSLEKCVIGKTLNAGQVCITADYIFVPEQALQQCIDDLCALFMTFYPEGAKSGDYVSIINDNHQSRLLALLDEARTEGCRIISCDTHCALPQANDLRKFPLQLVVNPPPHLRLSQEEIFGPILPIFTYRHFDEVIDKINDGNRPLACYYFGTSSTEIDRLTRETHAGGMTINDIAVHYACHDLPFGGIGHSGQGQLHGIYGFKNLSHAKGRFSQGWINLSKLSGLYPPYTDKAVKLIQGMLKP